MKRVIGVSGCLREGIAGSRHAIVVAVMVGLVLLMTTKPSLAISGVVTLTAVALWTASSLRFHTI